MKIVTIDIQAKEWFDKINGNSYFSAQVTVNFGMPDVIELKVPFQYGYGSKFEEQSFKALKSAGLIPQETVSFWRYCDENNIIKRSRLQEKCLKRDVKAWGE